ncbi:mycofactocin biosynthesis glycosyltransferase MftF [Pseudonocardia nematodicida]|uniref:Mycofactocin biosynthesis glycosyltransferase MftF n=1 Tax=Pseudonocardia nematodicida TaxID=1206997 RepID=A0ABV1KFH6_9PSEU
MTTARLPDGFRVTLGDDVRRRAGTAGGESLLGTVPPRLLHLTAAEAALVHRDGTVVVDGPATRRLARALLDAGLAHPTGPQPGAPTPDRVAVVVPVRDRPLERLLAALAAGPRLGGLVVVDDGSADPAPLARAVAEAGGALVRHPEPRGPAAARNTGLAAVRRGGPSGTPFVAFLDSDVVPAPDWLTPLLEHLADPAVALVAPRVTALHPEAGGLVGAYEALRSSLDLGTAPAPVGPHGAVSYVPGAAMLLRVAAVDGPAFDEDLHVAEDVDLLRRLDSGGWVARYEPAAQVAHDHRVAPTTWLRRKLFYGTGDARLARRHPGSAPLLTMTPAAAAVCAALIAPRRATAAVAAVAAAASTVRLARRLPRLRSPYRAAALLTAFEVVGGLWQAATALGRTGWPIAAVAALASRRARRLVAVVTVAEGLADWWQHRDRAPDARLPLPGYLLLHRVDDVAYGTGVWVGMVGERTLAPLRLRLRR